MRGNINLATHKNEALILMLPHIYISNMKYYFNGINKRHFIKPAFLTKHNPLCKYQIKNIQKDVLKNKY